MSEFLDRSLPDIAGALQSGALTATALVEAAIARHERFDERLGAYLLWTPELARHAAAAADAAFAAGAIAGPLQGIPISVKDLFAVSGLPTFAGSGRRLPPEWEVDGPLIARLRRQLGVITGKTHMVAFALGGTGLNTHYGTPRNPWGAPEPRAPGGSSSGAGVSLAEGSALLALGSDTAGSVRMPAAMTGQVGLKVTFGRWPVAGVVPLSPTFDTPGLLARSVVDLAYGFAGLDPAWGDWPAFAARCGGLALAGIRIGVGDAKMWEGCDPGIAEAAQGALDPLAKAGAQVRSAGFPEAVAAAAIHAEGGTSAAELLSFLENDLPAWLPELDPAIAPRVEAVKTLSARDFLRRLHRVRQLARAAVARFETVDVFAAPTVTVMPPTFDEMADPARFAEVGRRVTRNTVPANFLGLCAITLPVERDRAGLPVGLQLMAPGGQEERLIAVALAAERVLGDAKARLGTPSRLK